MQQQWTEKDIKDWKERREAFRKAKGFPPLHQLSSKLLSLERAAERESVEERLRAIVTKTNSWELNKRPLAEYPAPFSGTLYLPLHFRETGGHHTIKFSDGDDLNSLVYWYYAERADAHFEGFNFVSQDNIAARRHEYLGPNPYVADYAFDARARTARVEWWDAYLKSMWIGQDAWAVETYFDEVVEGWVSRPRDDVRRSPDMDAYLGDLRG